MPRLTGDHHQGNQVLVHSDAGSSSEDSVCWFKSVCVHQAPQAFSYSMPRHGGMPLNDNSTARQVGPVLNRSLLKSGIYILGVHKIWMCYLIYT